MTRKLAFFVEGHTESAFVERLVEEIAGRRNVRVELRSLRGGTNVRRTFPIDRAAPPDAGEKLFVLIVDCGGDQLVKSRIDEEHENLTRSGYEKIVGLRDVRPNFTHAQIPQLERGLRFRIKTNLIPVEFVLAVLEVEAWFLAEATHFERIDPGLTAARIAADLGFDPSAEDMSARAAPAADLDRCYGLVGKAYEKGRARDVVDALDFGEVYMTLPVWYPPLARLAGSVEAFLS